ncbi:MAG: ABC transporter ATP-binding protein [Thermoprotei archaeon]|nr:MAG: ABC transporter ATP-binding protein [Thermoprotei archaeon]
MGKIIVEMKDVTKCFGNVVALRGVNLEIYEGITGLIGPNGAGKTTTIGIILGLLRRDSGYLSVYGVDPWIKGQEVRTKIGFLDEKPVFPGNMTGRRFLRCVARIYGVNEESVNEVLKIVGLSRHADRSISTYSAGMIQRLGLAQALLGDKEFIILDEPTSNLDPIARIRILELIKSLRKSSGLSFLISTHILTELERVCDNIIVMYGGKVLGACTLDEIYNKINYESYILEFSTLEESKKVYSRVIEAGDADIDGRFVYINQRIWNKIREDIFQFISENGIKMLSLKPRYNAIEEYYKSLIGDTIEI